MSTEPEPGVMPEHMQIRYEDDPVMLTVDGQQFQIRVRAEEPGTYDFTWLGGPHDYGFSISGPRDSAMSLPEMKENIRGFLAQIDPATGYIAD